nr:histidine phosphatase family protein [Pandoraea nosoerga]
MILMRHPPPSVAPNVCYGRTDLDVDPSRFDAAVASMQARLTALLDGRRPTAVHSSPLRRARRAAEGIAASFALPVTEDARLAEMHFGAWEMQPWAAIDRNALEDWARNVATFAPPGGESARDVVLRMDAWARAIARTASAASAMGAMSAMSVVSDEAVHVAVTHAGPIRLHVATALQMPSTACLPWTLDFGGICHLHVARDGRARLIHWNA